MIVALFPIVRLVPLKVPVVRLRIPLSATDTEAEKLIGPAPFIVK